MGFDVGYADAFRDQVRRAIAQAAGGAGSFVNLDAVRDALYGTDGIPNQWRRLQCVENHDLVDDSHSGNDRQPRIAALADSTNSRSWYAQPCSRGNGAAANGSRNSHDLHGTGVSGRQILV